MSKTFDPSERIKQLEDAIRTHRSQKFDDRCVEDDDRLYEVLGDGIKCDRRIGSPEEMHANCWRFIKNRCEAGGLWMSYADLERENAKLRMELCEVLYQQCKEDRERNGPWPEFTGDGQ